MHRILKLLTSRLLLVIPLILLQLVFLLTLVYQFAISYQLLPVFSIVSVLVAVAIVNRNEDPAYKIAWCMLILSIPIIGVPLYLMAGNRKVPKKLFNGTIRASREMEGLLRLDYDLIYEISKEDQSAADILRYGTLMGDFPVYQNSSSRYYASGEEWFEDYKQSLREAKHFIFMEYFILDTGSCWEEVHEILKKKIREGVEVKLIYDDFGSITLPYNYDLKLKQEGMESYRFNHIRPAFIVRMNNRDHRKITVVDNRVAYTGGVNLADEYMNRIRRFGYWKDSAVRIEGEAVWSFTVMFLGMLSYCRPSSIGMPDYESYHLNCENTESDGGCYQPFSDTPTDRENTVLTMQLNLINHAHHYIYIDTPYLIPTEEVMQALMRAAKNGVDVRILTPGIPDKKLVFQITRGNYHRLLMADVRIYEYTPDFNHSKNFVMDDKMAIVGSANMDYRTYFLHLENGVLMYHTPEIDRIREDFEDSVKESKEITLKDEEKTNLFIRLVRMILNLFIPLV